MNNRLACHYSVVRFCPYPETDEFVNVGVMLACPAIGFLDGLRADLRLTVSIPALALPIRTDVASQNVLGSPGV